MQPLHKLTATVLLLLGFAPGCRERARPWEQAGGATDAPGAPPGLPPLPRPPASAAEPDAGPANDAAPPGDDDPLPLPVRVGGPWVRCYGNFRITGEPLKDVTRLSLLCGPENGMRRVSKAPIEGEVEQGKEPIGSPLEVKKGECYRIFAVAEPQVADLDVVVRSSRGAAIAADHSEDAWPIVQPDRPLCPLEDDAWTVELSARRGKGRAAAEVWALRVAVPD
ncbi:hypothetical protein [Polyangium aurulentum]|uniref:hypothetical protein n=1 Tax=Polyangium aurulentum TaxID=2567896 RepID=UPI0010ADE45D|nr:hypothetical protein [Polyangium aurulentum]UQA56618.1 hypothetical protein E8A73_035715 [Polyangium aurulentum]